MGCFLTCFGLGKKRKNLKSRNRSPSGEKRCGSYVPLDHEEQLKLDSTGNHVSSDPNLKEDSNEPTRLKVKKKVSFNLNVKAYEPFENQEEFSSESEEETKKWDLHYEEDSISSSVISSYPQNYRYQNCRDGYEEDDELIFEESDLDLDDDIGSDEELEYDYRNGSDEEAPKEDDCPLKLNHVANESESNQCIRDRSRYAFSVLNPVENLSQWKEVKAKAAPVKRLKENIILEELDQKSSKTTPDFDSFAFGSTRNGRVASIARNSIAVDASLSNWLGSLEARKNDQR